MWKMIPVLLLTLFASSAFATGYKGKLLIERERSSPASCPCSELDRRKSGLNMALSFADKSSRETEDLYCAIDEAGSALYFALNEREWIDRLETCRKGLRQTESTWNVWKLWIADNNMAVPHHCGFDDRSLPEYGWDAGLPHPDPRRRHSAIRLKGSPFIH